ICTKWFGPTSPLVSGGNTPFTLLIPSTLLDGPGIDGSSGVDCTTGSERRPEGCRDTRRHRGSRSLINSPCGGLPGGKSRSLGDRSNRSKLMTDVGEPARVLDGPGRCARISVIETSATRAATTNSRSFMAAELRKPYTD